jgi:glycolate oxidase iron-sulfur subunit
VAAVTLDLRLDDEELSSCVACGLCLPHCPTFRVTGEEGLSPRGRIDAMRGVQWRGAEVDDDFVRFMETCVQCRGCEPACPSGVPFGHLMEGTRHALAEQHRTAPRRLRAGLAVLGRHRLLRVGSTLLAVAQRLHVVPKRMGLPQLPIRQGPAIRATATMPESRHSVAELTWLFTGCVMDAWMRSTHRATAALLGAVGSTYAVPGSGGACCGALHAHAGLIEEASELARRVIASMPGEAPIVVNSAGCGAAMKDYGHLLRTDEGAQFAARVVDVHEYLAVRLDRLPAPRRPVPPVIVQDPCHLRHVQRAHEPVRTVLRHVTVVAELDDDGLCCGAGGAYSALQPELSSAIRERKLGAIAAATERSGATVVASANPGCVMHLAAAGVNARHPVDLVAEAVLP